jgi:predicted PurR-regulated permease PerM
VILATFAVVAVIVGFYLMYRFFNVLFVLFVAAVLATAMRPAVLWLQKHHVPQWGGVLLIYLALVLVTAAVFGTLAPLLVEQGSQIVQNVPEYYTDARDQLRESNSRILRRIGNNLPAELNISALGGTTQQQAEANGDEPSLVAQAVGYIRSIGWSLFGFLAVFLIAYFWTLDRDQIVRAGMLLVPIDYRPRAQELWDSAELKVGAYVRGQAVLMLAIGLLTGIALLIVGLPSALIVAVISGILEAVPYIGPILTAVVAITITLAEAPDKIWWVIGAMILVQQAENVLLVPRIMDRAVGVNPLVTLLAIAAFGSLMGVVGAILAIPLAAIIQVLLEAWVLNREAQQSPTIEGRDKASVIRYQAQDLAQDIRERIRARPSDQEEDDSIEERIEILVGEIDQLLIQASTVPAPQTISAPGGRLP